MKNYLLEENIDLKKYNTYGIGGTAKYLIRPKNVMGLKEALEFLKENNIKWYLLGGGSNVILPDEYFDGAILKLDLMNDFNVQNDQIYASAGITFSAFLNKMLEIGYTNMTNLVGIPGTLGGAIVGNAESFKVSTFEYLINVTVMDSFGKITTISKEFIKYGYRYSEFKGDATRIIIGATFKGIKGDVTYSRQMIKKHTLWRKNAQPLEYKNAGSVFKNGDGYSAGAIIDSAGLKGKRIGDAEVSQKHANFIINLKNASAHDIISLIEEIKFVVERDYSINLELEQIIVKW
jgi:UDP-N-acetylmuramate dehydrogenase